MRSTCSALSMPALTSGSASDAADGEARIERVERVLEHELCLAPEVRSSSPASPASSARRTRSSPTSARPASAAAAPSWSCRSRIRPAGHGLAELDVEITSSTARTRRPLAAQHLARASARRGSAWSGRERRRAFHVAGSLADCGEDRPRRRASRREVWVGAAVGAQRRARRADRQAKGQRAAKRQPGGGSRRSGGATGDRHQLVARALKVGEGVGEAHRVGMARPLQHVSRTGPLSTTSPAYITTTSSQT